MELPRVGHERGFDCAAKTGPGPEGIFHGRGLISTMHHAVGALFVAAGPVAIPCCTAHELLEGLGITILEQITRLLPAEGIVGRIPPGRALVLSLPHQELEKQRGLVKAPIPLAIA